MLCFKVAPQVGEYRIAIFVPEQTTAKVWRYL